ncbi:MAG: VWA domain-containing protein [Blautia sp.]|nr:VWA domain-containing protein [Lachnoclostridium sp.]MCM1210354.1 VWA domain-containing protein [Blautia sp.]
MKKFQGKQLQKRGLGLLLTAAMLTGVLGGCGKAESDSAPAADNAVKGGTSGNAGAANDAGENFYEDAGESSYADVEAESGQYTDDVVSSADMDDAYNSSADRVSGGFARAEEKSMEYTPYDEYPLPEEYFVSPPDTEEYNALEELGFMAASVNPLSTFSADVDTASYSNLRRMIEDGYGLQDIPEGAVRIEELLNYFHYDYVKPKKGEPFGVTTQIADCPWNANTKIAMIGLKTQDIDFSEAPASNLVFLLDVSGSMYSEDKLPLLQKSFSMLTENLTAKDRVSIVTYAGEDRVILEGVQGTEQKEIIDALDVLEAGGSTAGSAGITTAYGIAEKYFIKGGNNRIILATDGDLNVGLTTEEELDMLISEKKESGVYLSVLGFGTGNIKDNKMEILADKGNGNYAYIDSLSEAKKVLVEELGATFVTVAEDVKFQVEFNPDVIAGYRLIGYENRQLAEQDFADDTKDAGEIGAGHSVTVLYEIVTTDAATTYAGTSLKYADKKKLPDKEWFTVNIRYKKPNTSKSLLSSYPVDKADYKKEVSQDMQFAMAVAEFGLVVNDSSYKGDATMRTVIDRLKEIDTKSDEYKDEFCYLVRRLEKN